MNKPSLRGEKMICSNIFKFKCSMSHLLFFWFRIYVHIACSCYSYITKKSENHPGYLPKLEFKYLEILKWRFCINLTRTSEKRNMLERMLATTPIISWNNKDHVKAQYSDTTTFHHFEYIWWESVKERIC